MLTEPQIELIEQSFSKIVPKAAVVAIMFYDRLFELQPQFSGLFPDDMTEQRGKLISTLATVVQSLRNLEEIVPAVQDLGRRHVTYNVHSKDYGPVGEALLWALEQTLGPSWNAETEGAWKAAYALLAKTMIDAADAYASEISAENGVGQQPTA